jgi:hypothetical protein
VNIHPRRPKQPERCSKFSMGSYYLSSSIGLSLSLWIKCILHFPRIIMSTENDQDKALTFSLGAFPNCYYYPILVIRYLLPYSTCHNDVCIIFYIIVFISNPLPLSHRKTSSNMIVSLSTYDIVLLHRR